MDEENLENGWLLLKDWYKMDTSGAIGLTDEQLFGMIEHVRIKTGWGLVAELMKRYAVHKNLMIRRIVPQKEKYDVGI